MKSLLFFILMFLPASETKHTIKWTDSEGKNRDQALYLGEPELHKRIKRTTDVVAGDRVIIPYRFENIQKRSLPEWIHIQPVRIIPIDDAVKVRRGKPKKDWIIGYGGGSKLHEHFRLYPILTGRSLRYQFGPNWPPRQPFDPRDPEHWKSVPEAVIITWSNMRGDAIYIDLRKEPFIPGVLSTASGGTLREVNESSDSGVENWNTFLENQKRSRFP